jgi:C4-dicarboxylate transporter DctM subunit
MSPIEIGIGGVVALFVFMLLGMPIGLTMGLIGFLGLVLINGVDAALIRLGLTAFSSTNSYLISLLPLFTLMGEFAFASGITRDAYDAGYKWIGHRNHWRLRRLCCCVRFQYSNFGDHRGRGAAGDAAL